MVSGSTIKSALFAVDGENGICSHSPSSKNMNSITSWTLQLSIQRIVFDIIVYLKQPLQSDTNVTLVLTGLTQSSKERKFKASRIFREKTKTLRFLPGLLWKVKLLTLIVSSVSLLNESYFDLSEVDVFGACERPKYSGFCELSCPEEPSNNVCHYDGKCDTNASTVTSITTLTTKSTPKTSLSVPLETPAMTTKSTPMTSLSVPLETTAMTTKSTPKTSLSVPLETTAMTTKSTPKTSLSVPLETTAMKTKKPFIPSHCPLGFFGKTCQYLCHCKDKLCRRDGECMVGSYCEDAWFALACQYRDLARAGNSSDQRLTDNDDSTCYSPPDNVISVNLSEPFVYTWMRGVFNNNVSNISLSFQEPDICEHLRLVSEEKNQLDIFCSNQIVTTYVRLAWQGNGSICSLYINGGRNLATESYIEVPKDETLFNKNLLKDDITSGTACLHMSSDQDKKLIFKYNDPQTVISINVYTEEVLMTNKFIIQVSFDNTDFSYRSLPGRRQPVYFSNSSKSKTSNITFQVIEGSIKICEIKIYGDCAPPHYFLGCIETCIFTCYKHLCNYNGACYICRHGRKGSHCMEVTVNSTKDWIDQKEEEETQRRNKKKKGNSYVLIFLIIPIMALAAFTYNVFDLYKRDHSAGNNIVFMPEQKLEILSEQSNITDEPKSYASSNFEESSEGKSSDNLSEIESYSV